MIPFETVHVTSLRRDGLSPSFLETDRSPGVYSEFIERWRFEDGSGQRIQLRIRSSNVHDQDPQHGFYETGRRFELFSAESSLFLEDMGMAVALPGMLHVSDSNSGMTYRFRQV